MWSTSSCSQRVDLEGPLVKTIVIVTVVIMCLCACIKDAGNNIVKRRKQWYYFGL